MRLVDAARTLSDTVDELEFTGRVAYVYNPLAYAWDPHRKYLEAWGADRPRRAVFVGMNPGPWGMAQTGVPFGDIKMVTEWLGITGRVEQPPVQHPKRPVQGFDVTRREASGSRLWGWASERFGTPDAFFRDFFVVNYCPLVFFTEDGANLTPPQLRKADEEHLYAACDAHLAEVVRYHEPEWVLGIGKFAEKRIRAAAEAFDLDVRVDSVLHPSPANPRANKGWGPQAEEKLTTLGVL